VGEIIVSCPRSPEDSSMRDAVGLALVELGGVDEGMVVVTADVAHSTRATFFAERYPERFVNVGIAEQDLVCFAAGLALAGKKPYALAFSMFMMRAWEQIRNTIDRMNLDVRLIATHSGFSDHADGESHQSLEDIALMRSLHNMTVIVPADAPQAYNAVKAMHRWRGPVYFRIGRDYSPRVTSIDTPFHPGRLQLLREGSDAAIVSCGPLLAHSLKAAEMLRHNYSLDIAVANMHTVKPVDAEGLEKLARETGLLFVVEEHGRRGGVYGAVTETLAERYPAPVHPITAKGYGRSARSVQDLYTLHDLTPEAIARRILEVVMEWRRRA